MPILYVLLIFLSLTILFRQSFVSVAVIVHCTDVKGKRHSRMTFSLSIKSVLT